MIVLEWGPFTEYVYDVPCSQIETDIEEAKKQIVDYKEKLQEARIIRRHRQEYDALAKVCVATLLYSGTSE